MGIFDKDKEEKPEKKPDFSGVRTGSGSTLGEKPAASTPPAAPSAPTSGAGSGATPEARRTYVVESGDNLSKIAKRFYGDANQWPKIHEANRDQIKDPDLIHPGQKLIIP